MLDSLAAPELDPETIRALVTLGGVAIPLLIATAQYIARPPDRQGLGALALTIVWNSVFLLIGNELAISFGWWTFANAGPELGNVPVALLLGWAVLWGPVAAQLHFRPAVTIALLLAIDLVAMPLMDMVVILGPNWLIGEAVLLAFVALPGLLLARWMGEPDRVTLAASFQVLMFAAILLWTTPRLATLGVGQDLTFDVPTWAFGAVVVALGAPSLPALIAVRDFAINNGTPWPWDTTDRAVLSGPYRYVRSPMQMSGGLVLVATTLLYGQWPIAVAALATMLFAQLFCLLEHEDLAERFGPEWTAVTQDQRQWIPRWRPHAQATAGTIWINEGCSTCNPIADFIASRDPVALEVRWAHEHDEALTRVRYERADGATFTGVAAVGAALEHLNLGWAFVGWLLRLPVAWRMWQLVGDAVGFGPRPAVAKSLPEIAPAAT